MERGKRKRKRNEEIESSNAGEQRANCSSTGKSGQQQISTQVRPNKYRFILPRGLIPNQFLLLPQHAPSIVMNFPGYHDIGSMDHTCQFCYSKMWYGERLSPKVNTNSPKFSMCCQQGRVLLPSLQQPPDFLIELFKGSDRRSTKFLNNIRAYNMMFAFTSLGGKVQKELNNSGGPYVYRMHGQNYHLMGSLLPVDSSKPKFSQLYIYDTENEIPNRLRALEKSESSNELDPKIVHGLKDMMDQHNELAKCFRSARDRFQEAPQTEFKLRLLCNRERDGRTYNLPTASEVAVLIVGDLDSMSSHRDIILEHKDRTLQRINELHPSYLALQYPILFPYGEEGYRLEIKYRQVEGRDAIKRKDVTMREFFAYRLQQRDVEFSTILSSRRLFHQFIVDAYTMIESDRLKYVRLNQKKLRADVYNGLTDAVVRGETNPNTQGKRIILPSSFTGGARYMIQNYQDAMAIVTQFGNPDLFITFTCNPKWPEIEREVKKAGVRPEDRPDLVTRVFKIKLNNLIADLKDQNIFGHPRALVYTIEFQKRGLLHAHIVLFLQPEFKLRECDDIDKVISAELPDPNLDYELFNAVQSTMIHGPCGYLNKKALCMENGKCGKYYPRTFNQFTTVREDGYPIYRRRNTGITAEKNKIPIDNRYVVPYNPYLLRKYRAHINVEWCYKARSIKYLFKYISAAEGMWRILSFDIHYRIPAVERLSCHLPNQQYVVYNEDQEIEQVVQQSKVQKTTLTAWFETNRVDPDGRTLSYAKFPMKYTWKESAKVWVKRQQRSCIGRIHNIPPGSGECWYLRILLNKAKGCQSFEDVRTVDGVVYPTYKDACHALGIIDDDQEFVEALEEVNKWGTASYLRTLFATFLLIKNLHSPLHVWTNCWKLLADDFLHGPGNPNITYIVSESEAQDKALQRIEEILKRNGRTLADFEGMPVVEHIDDGRVVDALVREEMQYDKEELSSQLMQLLPSLTTEQKEIFDCVINAISTDQGGVYFVHGFGGSGKTFLWNTLAASVRSRGEVLINVASSGIASLLLPGGRTSHSRFSIPLSIAENSTCNIKRGSPKSRLLIATKLIIWDEAPMTHKYCFEALDKTLRDICSSVNPKNEELPFGGKIVVLGGDFRQTLPVIPKGTREEIVMSAINSSYLWDYVQVKHLTINMRLMHQSNMLDREEVERFARWILQIGEGTIGKESDRDIEVEIPPDLLIHSNGDNYKAIVDSTYPDLHNNLSNFDYLEERAILAPTLEIVEGINNYILSTLPGEEVYAMEHDG
ncbi:unnamed protein product [Cuscuta europaea]|uniref:ATP-dependent DNA helicase n=1 Tax=Cuscuta europaea TaxID=41803 RepID=A0A9P0YKC3_CUSEU|nr:unnamed protein product [Cuscuta europaea]